MSESAQTAPTRVLVVDDQPMIRAGIALMLSTADGLEVVGQAGDGREAVTQARALHPDVILMDIRMPGMDGIAATREILRPDAGGGGASAGAGGAGVPEGEAAGVSTAPSVLVLTTFDHDEYVIDALAAGASGFLLKDASTEELVSAVRAVARGEALLDPAVTRAFLDDYVARRSVVRSEAQEHLVALLTARELELVRLLAQGMSNLELAAALVLSEQTVKTHIRNILAKLQLRDRTQIVVFAFRNGLDAGDPSAQTPTPTPPSA